MRGLHHETLAESPEGICPNGGKSRRMLNLKALSARIGLVVILVPNDDGITFYRSYLP
jgi:hypothetical protein